MALIPADFRAEIEIREGFVAAPVEVRFGEGFVDPF